MPSWDLVVVGDGVSVCERSELVSRVWSFTAVISKVIFLSVASMTESSMILKSIWATDEPAFTVGVKGEQGIIPLRRPFLLGQRSRLHLWSLLCSA